MRKRYQRNACSCGLCKPHKRGRDHRRTAKQLQLVELASARCILRCTALEDGVALV